MPRTFVVDFREDPLGDESLVSAMLYPLEAEKQLFRLRFPEGYRHRDTLRRLTQELHVHLQRTYTENEGWLLVVLMDQLTSKHPAWGSLSHQISALREHVLVPLRENHSQEPALTIGIVPDYWDRKTQTQIPKTSKPFLQWSLDHFGLLRFQTLPEPPPIPPREASEHSHLLHENDRARIADGSEAEIQSLFESKIESIPTFQEKDGDILPPAHDPNRLRSIRDQLLEGLHGDEDFSPWSSCRRLASKHFSALGEIIQEQLNDLVLFRIPMGREPLPRRRRDLIYLDYMQGILPLLDGIDLRETLADINDNIRAYWFGTLEIADRVASIEIDASDLFASVERYGTHLQEQKASLDQEDIGSFQLDLLEPFDHDCELTFSKDWESTVQDLNSFSFLRRAASSNPWPRWVDEVEENISRKYDRLSSKLSDCLTEARQEREDPSTRTEEGEEISSLVTQLEKTAEAKRQGVLDRSSEGFTHNWSERAESLAAPVQNALELRPTRQQLSWSLGAVFPLSILLLLPSSNFATSRATSLVFLAILGLLLGLLGFYLARRRLISLVKMQTKRATREAENVIDQLHQFVRGREEAIENYFEALIAKKNLKRARRKQKEIELRRLHHHFHQQALSQHLDEASALHDFLSYSDVEIEEMPSDTLERLDRPPHVSSVYWFTRSDPTAIEAFNDDVNTELLPGLRRVTVEADPAFGIAPEE